MIYTWSFNTNARDQNNQHPFRRMNDGVEATVSASGKLDVTTVGYVCDISDIDLSRKWSITFFAKDDASSNIYPTYFMTVGPVFQSTSVGGVLCWRPGGSTSVFLDDSPCVANSRRQCTPINTFNQGWHQPFNITFDQLNPIRQFALYNQGVRCNQKTMNAERDLDTYGKYIYVGCLVDSSATPCSFDLIELNNDWDGINPYFAPVVNPHSYYRVRLLGACTVAECSLDPVRSTTTDDGTTVPAVALSVTEGSITDPVLSKLVDRVYNATSEVVITPSAASGWTTIQYGYFAPTEMVQLRIAMRSTSTPPQWCEISYSNDGLSWYLEDRFPLPITNFQINGVRANCVATYQRVPATGMWSFVRSFAVGK